MRLQLVSHPSRTMSNTLTSSTMTPQQASSQQTYLRFPSRFFLKDLAAVTAPVYTLKRSPYQDVVDKATRVWFEKYTGFTSLSRRTCNSFRAYLVLVCTITRNSSVSSKLESLTFSRRCRSRMRMLAISRLVSRSSSGPSR